MPTYYAYKLDFPNTHPYDKLEFRWQSFLGEFVRPILVQNPSLQCAVSYYIKHAEIYVYTDDFTTIQEQITELEKNGFVTEKMNRTLEDNFGSERFLGQNSESNPTRRGELILRSLRALCDLLVDSIHKQDDGYWNFETSADRGNNPTGNHFFSILHLHHLITRTYALIYPLLKPDGNILLLDHYTYLNHQEEYKDHKLIVGPQQCLP